MVALSRDNLPRHHFYFNITAQVSRCSIKRLIGNDYEGILVTAKLGGQGQIASIIANDDDIMWGLTPNS
ncbi:hypothetical protein [Vibrio coralliilyticus]|uniref:hypothetical protein n=1 Tax=Vibrio coralliilyticus TaxID=190893 RepID=UPI00183B5545|nr:hypothetical protein [Vibrio coralliilyticus]NUW67091.1 hypothetical protein [Vibrio coralliilyticus]